MNFHSIVLAKDFFWYEFKKLKGYLILKQVGKGFLWKFF